MNDTTKIAVSFDNKVNNLSELTKYERELQKIYGYISALKNPEAKSAMKNIDKSVKGVEKALKEDDKTAKQLTNSFKAMFSVKAMNGFIKGIQILGKNFLQLSQKSAEYIENVNLLEVAYKNANETIEQSSQRIEAYIDKMSEVYGLDESRLTRQFGIFKQLANAMQLPTETAENLSEIMVKMTNDIASLYNLDLNRASNALQSALAGQVRPIRSATGADITEKTLQNTVDALGLDRTINQLSYVEKRLVMVISLTNQLKNSQGDYARTIESASNQIRVMHEQWDRLSRAVGNVFYPILEKVLPYVNGILMALTEIFNLLASLVGFKMPEFDYSGMTGVSDLAQDIEDELVGAGDATDALANKLKGLRSFDKLNVISTPSTSGGASASATAGFNVDPKIMEAFNNAFSEYDDMMGKIQMKATKIRDAIMEWLGFTKEVDAFTGEISWKFDHLTFGTILAGLGVGGAIYNGVSGILNMFTKLTGLEFTWLTPLAKVVGILAGGIGLGELFSLGIGEFERAFGLNITGYAENDMFGMWGDMVKLNTNTKKYLSNSLSSKEQDILTKMANDEDFYNAIMTGEGAENYINDILPLFDSIKAQKQQETSNIGDFLKFMGKFIINPAGATSERIQQTTVDWKKLYDEELDKIRNLASYSMFGDNMFALPSDVEVTSMDNYTNAISEYFTQVQNNLPNISSFAEIISNMQNSADKASEGFENLLAKFADSHYQIVGEDLDQINTYLLKLKESADTSAQAYYDAILNITLGLQEQGYVAEETAEKVIDSAYRKRLAEEGNTQQFIDSMAELERQFRNNEITEQEYYKQAVKIYKQFKQAPSALQTFKGKLDVFSSSIKVTGDNWDAISRNLGQTKTTFDETMSSMQTQYEQNLEYLIKLRDTYDESSEDYKEIQKEIDALTQQNADSMKEATDAYTNYLLNTLQTINESAERDSKEAKEYMESINKELSQYGVNVDLSKGKENISKQIDEIQNDIESRHPKMTFNVEGNTNSFKDKINSLVYQLQNSPLLDFLLPSNIAKTLKYAVGNFLLYDKGGLPPVGQLFVANEHGAELVGHIGGQSFVANQNQMMDLLDKKIGNAQNSQKQPQVFNFYLDADHKIGTYTLDQLQDLAKTNGQAITIG